MGLFICSTNLVSIRTVRAQVEGELTAVVGDCQNVLFNVTVPPQVVIVSVHQGEQDNSYLILFKLTNHKGKRNNDWTY
jgi:hypothetical protein